MLTTNLWMMHGCEKGHLGLCFSQHNKGCTMVIKARSLCILLWGGCASDILLIHEFKEKEPYVFCSLNNPANFRARCCFICCFSFDLRLDKVTDEAKERSKSAAVPYKHGLQRLLSLKEPFFHEEIRKVLCSTLGNLGNKQGLH